MKLLDINKYIVLYNKISNYILLKIRIVVGGKEFLFPTVTLFPIEW